MMLQIKINDFGFLPYFQVSKNQLCSGTIITVSGLNGVCLRYESQEKKKTQPAAEADAG